MESELERLQLEVKGTVYGLAIEQLVRVCESLHIAGTTKEYVTGKTRSQLIAHVIQYLDQEDQDELEDGGMAALLHAQDIIGKELVPCDTSNANEREQEHEQLQQELEALRLAVREKETAVCNLIKVDAKGSSHTDMSVRSVSPVAPDNSVWKREFKISGQIGEPGQKDRLTFSSLARQIESGFNKGYSELEITDAVIRAITPGLQLRSYLEGKENLTLPALRRILRSHYQERSATELYKQLAAEVQSSKETAQNFLMRAMDLRQRILFASQEAQSSLKYDPALVQSLFLHAVLTGLQNDSIRSDLQPCLLQSDTSDEVLLERVNIACANEKERQDKRKHVATTRTTNVNIVHTSEGGGEKKTVTPSNVNALPPETLSEIKEIRSDMVLLKDLKAEVLQIREAIQKSTSPTQQSPPPDRGHEQLSIPPAGFGYSPPAHVDVGPNYAPVYGPPPPITTSPRYQMHQGYERERAPFQPRFTPPRQYPEQPPQYPTPRPRPRCTRCIQVGNMECQHCFRCGSSEHFRAGCRARMFQKSVREDHLN